MAKELDHQKADLTKVSHQLDKLRADLETTSKFLAHLSTEQKLKQADLAGKGVLLFISNANFLGYPKH